MSDKKERKIFVLREVEVSSMLDIKEGDLFRLEPVDENDREFEIGNWYRAEKDGQKSDKPGGEDFVQCDPIANVDNQFLKGVFSE